ncbi:Phage terminase large subunit (XtmB) (PDB:4IDH) [Commensalibacter communis]|uniref:Phage terminase large subunit (XtmB) n=1 Tax=Commensalibacter communis TaxID=2972786 RepID=A0A9W4X7K2_9PROT|nr:PBSX family phage terminase large subunit [Commensalibacter communis]CAI3957918.1 Phage terminase large subunit (XtmB) (PDB:4IDH) [Commensalibacter communis]CAI3960232.1 Phage terminase large subunit (XtmB) (PDB:4IDH) [Commensalibacter communis]
MVEVQIAKAYQDLFIPARYKMFYGGRGGAKSWGFATALIIMAARKKLRVLCAREFQKSLKDSVHQLLCDSIDRCGLTYFFKPQNTEIIGRNGSEFTFIGLARNIASMKSAEGFDIVWVEEAQTISQRSIDFLRPTIRKSNSELWFGWNPDDENDPIQLLKNSLEIDQEQKSIIKKVTWRDNPWFPEVLNKERLHCLRTNPAQYNHIWEGDFITSLSEFFKEKDLLIDGQPIETPEYINSVFAVIDTTLKGGEGKDGTGIIYLGYNQFDPAIPLVILDWDLMELEGNLLSTWLKTVYEHIEILSQETKAIHGIAGIFIEDKAVGSILLQDAISDRRDDVFAIDSKLTALGKDKRCILISDVVNSGKVKITQRAYNKTVIFRKISRNHLMKQILSFTPGDKEADKRQDDLLDCFSYGVAIGLKDSLKNVRE